MTFSEFSQFVKCFKDGTFVEKIMFQFKVSLYEKSKPNGKRSLLCGSSSYENCLFSFPMDDIHKRATGYHYDWMFLNQSVFVQRTNINLLICEYKIQVYDCFIYGKLKGEFVVEMECLNPPQDKQSQELLFEHYKEIGKKFKVSKTSKSKHLTTWVLNESGAIRVFVIQLQEAGSLKKLKKEIPKATYYRNLKICEEKGYVKDKKLVKRVWVSKLD